MSTRNISDIHLDQITCNPQVRKFFDLEKIEKLAESKRAVGWLQPITVRRAGERYVIIDGECRYRAAQFLGEISISAIVVEDELSPGEIMQRQLISNCQRTDLNPVERAIATDDLMKAMNWSAKQAAMELGFNAPEVTRSLALLTLPEAIRDLVASGAIGPSSAYELTLIANADEQRRFAEALAAGSLTRDQLNAARKGRAPSSTRRRSASRAAAALGGGRSVTVCAPELTLDGFIECLESATAKARRAKSQGLGLPTFAKVLRDQAKD